MVDAAQVAQWLAQLRQGTLAETDIEQALERLKQDGISSPVQRLLFLQTHTTDLESPVLGMSTVDNGRSTTDRTTPIIGPIRQSWRP